MWQNAVNEHIPNEAITMFGLRDSTKIAILTQARRQDLAAGGAKNQKEGLKTRKGGHIF